MVEKKSVLKKLFSKPDKDCCNVEFEEVKSTEDNDCCDKKEEKSEKQQNEA